MKLAPGKGVLFVVVAYLALSLSSIQVEARTSTTAGPLPEQIFNWLRAQITLTGIITVAISFAGIVLAYRRQRRKSHLEIFQVKDSSDIHVKNVGTTDALDLEVSVLGKKGSAPLKTMRAQRIKKDDELRIPLAGVDLPGDGKIMTLVSYRNSNDKVGKVRKRDQELVYVPPADGLEEPQEPSTAPPIQVPVVLSRNRLAVLPLANISPDPADEYFSDGMTEELIDKLSQVRDLKVIARTSVMGYKKKVKRASEIGRELGVGSIVEGSVRKAGNKIRITVQLIDTRNDEHLWSSAYDKDLDDVFAIQSEIAEKVSTELKVKLLDSEKRSLEKRPIGNPEAYTLYLKGRYYWSERTKEGVDKAVEYQREAIRRAPTFSFAHAALADCYLVYPDLGLKPPADAYPKAMESARKAIELDPSMAEPHATLGAVLATYEYAWEAGEAELMRAFELKPNYPTAHHWYSIHLRITGRLPESFEEIKRAGDLDPLSRVIGLNVGEVLLAMGRHDEGLEVFRGIALASPEFAYVHYSLAWGLYLKGMKDEAKAEMKSSVELSSRDPFFLGAQATLLGLCGETQEPAALLDELVRRASTEYIDKGMIASAMFGNHRLDEAFAFLEKAFEERSHYFLYFRTMPWLREFLEDRRWLAFESRLGLPRPDPLS